MAIADVSVAVAVGVGVFVETADATVAVVVGVAVSAVANGLLKTALDSWPPDARVATGTAISPSRSNGVTINVRIE